MNTTIHTWAKVSRFALPTLLVLFLWIPTQAAATVEVGNGTPQSCTESALKDALSQGGEITFNCGSNPHTITFTASETLSADVTIDGGNRITLSGGNAHRLFNVPNGRTLSLRRLAIVDTAVDGHAINSAGVLNVDRVTFRNNQRGAIYNAGGTVTVTSSIFEDNESSQGGAITNENAGTLTVSDSRFTNNQTTGSGHGGAIYSSTGSTATIRDSQFFRNHSPGGNAGAIYNTHVMTIEHTFIEDNQALGGGGGIYSNGMLTIRNSFVTSNTAGASGGGIAQFNQTESPSRFILESSTIEGNLAKQMGGGLFVSGALVTFEAANVTVSYNTSTEQGGGGLFVTNSNATLTNVTLFENSAIATGGNNLENSTDLPGTITLRNTLVVNGECAGTITDGGGNLEFPTDSCGAGFADGDPALGALDDNGGWTPTHAIGEGSAAQNSAQNDNCPPTDQRGVLRPQFATCDIGAFEWGALPVLGSLAPTSTLALSPTFTLNVNGANLIPGPSGSRVLWNGTPLATSYVNGTQLRATVPADLFTAGGTATVTVETPVIDGGISEFSRIFTIFKRDQQITFGPLADRGLEPNTFTLNAEATSNLPVTFSAQGACTVEGSTVTLTGLGECTITAQQPGNAAYNAAPSVSQSFNIVELGFVYLPMVQQSDEAR